MNTNHFFIENWTKGIRRPSLCEVFQDGEYGKQEIAKNYYLILRSCHLLFKSEHENITPNMLRLPSSVIIFWFWKKIFFKLFFCANVYIGFLFE